ncbi:chorismate synthase [Aulographum hederae CBS 113979]|uniref:Chorismate synthase n=1 Tax=Aulographum hederae CBS 113979 TaxID=1176131 RepID=A0A6G1H0W3_9PEZI|nr:chorismate synthase [Aulographum hederae CBS 113979]
MSTFGQYFRVTTYGESHCKSVGCIVDGCPPGMELTEEDIQPQLTRRRPGQSAITTPRNEQDLVEIQSGTEFGITLGTPIGMKVMNKDQRPKDYGGSTMDMFPRPSHADWTYLEKYGVKASSGGGRSSARETIGRVSAGAIAEKYLSLTHGVEIIAFVASVGNEFLFPPTPEHPTQATNPKFLNLINTITREHVDSPEFLPIRCPDKEAADRMKSLVEKFRDAHDSIGGTVTCVIRNVPSGLGEPCFDKLEALIGHAMLSIPSTKAATISQAQDTVTYDSTPGVLEAKGRHDPCVVPRAIPIVESMAALAIMDATMAQLARSASRQRLPPLKGTLPTKETLLGGAKEPVAEKEASKS